MYKLVFIDNLLLKLTTYKSQTPFFFLLKGQLNFFRTSPPFKLESSIPVFKGVPPKKRQQGDAGDSVNETLSTSCQGWRTTL
jgi:hypothetical protein